MASEPFSIEIASFEGGYSQSPFVGGQDQYSFANKLDQYSEPGSLVGQIDVERFAYGPISSNSSFYLLPYALAQTNVPIGTDNIYYGSFRGVGNNILTLVALDQASGGSLLAVRFDSGNSFNTSLQETRPTPMIPYLDTMLVAADDDTVSQFNKGYTSSSLVRRTRTSYVITDMATHFGYAYLSWIPGVTASTSSPSVIERFDGSAGLALDNATARLDAIELELGWFATSIERYGDYIAVAATPLRSAFYTGFGQVNSSRIYLWDGISTTFDTKVDVYGAAVTALSVANGQLYAFATTPGAIDIYRYAGGNVTQRVGRVSVAAGVVKNTEAICFPYVRNEAISVKGDMIYFGVSVPTISAARSYVYSFNTRTGTVDLFYKPRETDNIRAITSVLITNEFSAVGFQTTQATTASYGRYVASGNETAQRTAGFSVTTDTYFAPTGKKMRIKRVLVRHSYVPSANSIALYVNRNLEIYPRTSGASYNAANSLLTISGADANVPGVGDASVYEHAYSFQDSAGAPVPLLDSFQVTLVASNSSGLDRTRVFLPIIVEGEVIDSPN